jgi:hypothetical protein
MAKMELGMSENNELKGVTLKSYGVGFARMRDVDY